jgi:hypothetical protein
VSPELTGESSGNYSNALKPTLADSHPNQPTNSYSASHSNPLLGNHSSAGQPNSLGGLSDQARLVEGDTNRTPGGLWNHQSATEVEQNEFLRWLLEEPAAQTTLFDFNFDLGQN